MAEIDDPFMTLESDNSATATLDRPFEPLEEERSICYFARQASSKAITVH